MKGSKAMNLAFKIGVFDKRLNRTIISVFEAFIVMMVFTSNFAFFGWLMWEGEQHYED